MKEIVIKSLELIHPLSAALKQWLTVHLKERSLTKREIFLSPGEICSKISFITKGLLRSFSINDDGIDTTVWFMKEGDVTISVKSFYERSPGLECIEAIEESTLFYITYDELQEVYFLFPEFNIVGRIITQSYYILSEERLLGIRNKKAIDRYKFLLKYHPEIILRAHSQYIASYLDIDKATLSRLKSRL